MISLFTGCSESARFDKAAAAKDGTADPAEKSAAVDLDSIPQADPADVVPGLPNRAVPRYHEVQRGETLSKIAAQYGTTVEAFASTNGIHRDDLLHPGDFLQIPE